MRSMTGYGKGMSQNENFEVTVEIKSVNNRFLDLNIRLPKELNHEEVGMRDFIKSKILRGKINVFVNIRENPQSESDLFVNWEAIKKNFNHLNAIRQTLGIKEAVRLEHLLSFPEVFNPNLEEIAQEQLHPLIMQALEAALDEFLRMSEREGKNILDDVRGRLQRIGLLTNEIEELAPVNVQDEFDRLYQNTLNLIGEKKIDKTRLEQEIAIISDRVDITEEIVRMKSHLDLFNKTLNTNGEVGKRLNFILQEMNREANTMNSKTTMLEISHRVIKIKEEVEKLREQIQNIE
ncbi:YicC family protein [candidate division KSB1 bacterium]|nr:MAG: YicC family protein [candidate division KSB1 bacterium]